jgi:hypothetical protein
MSLRTDNLIFFLSSIGLTHLTYFSSFHNLIQWMINGSAIFCSIRFPLLNDNRHLSHFYSAWCCKAARVTFEPNASLFFKEPWSVTLYQNHSHQTIPLRQHVPSYGRHATTRSKAPWRESNWCNGC